MQKFSFLSDIIHYQNGQETEIHSRFTYPTEVTIQLQSSYSDLDNKVFQLLPNQTLLFKYRPKVDGFITIIRIWGAILDFSGFLDLDFKIVKNFKPVIEVKNEVIEIEKIEKITSYDFQGWTNIEIFKTVTEDNQFFDFWLNEQNDANYTITCNDNAFEIENQNLLFKNYQKDSFCEINKNDLASIIICLNIQFGGNTYHLQGAQNIYELEQELLLIFANDSKIKVIRKDDSIIIFSKYSDRNKLKFNGVDTHFTKTFQSVKNDSLNVRLKCLNRNWHYKQVELKINANGLVRRPNMLIHFENKQTSNNIFELESELSINNTVKLFLKSNTTISNKFLQTSDNIICENNMSFQYDEKTIYWYVKALSGNIANFTVKNLISSDFPVLAKIQSVNLLYNLQITKDEVLLKVYLNQESLNDYNYTITFQNQISVENIDYKLITEYHKINKGQTDKKERIVWTTNSPIRSFNIVLNKEIIPVFWIDKSYYPSIISLRNNLNVAHFLNRSINRELTLKYLDGLKKGNIIIPANTTDFQYQAINKNVNWQIYDGQYLIFEQNIEYFKEIDKRPMLRLIVDDIINAKSMHYLIVKLDWPVKFDVDFEIITNNNTDINIAGKYRLKADQIEMKFKLTPIRLKLKPSYLSLQITSANVEFDNKKYTIIIN